jgi:excisionase family DNA binding protein
MRHVLRDSLVIILTVFVAMWFVPFAIALVDVGSVALLVPLLIALVAIYLVSTHMRHIHTQVEDTFRKTLLGEEHISASEAAALLGLRVDAVAGMAEEGRLAGVKIRGRWRIDKASVVALIKAHSQGTDKISKDIEEAYLIEFGDADAPEGDEDSDGQQR